MEREEYKQKLIAFNSTPKYKQEMELLFKLMTPKNGEKILDYGCGLGTMVHYVNEHSKAMCYGYDVRNFREKDDPLLFRDSFFFQFHKIFFMHSIAHLPQLDQKLQDLKQFLLRGARVFVVTPNKLWLSEAKKEGYVPDPTVVNHFCARELEEIFTRNGYSITTLVQFGSILNHQHERIFIEVAYA